MIQEMRILGAHLFLKSPPNFIAKAWSLMVFFLHGGVILSGMAVNGVLRNSLPEPKPKILINSESTVIASFLLDREMASSFFVRLDRKCFKQTPLLPPPALRSLPNEESLSLKLRI